MKTLTIGRIAFTIITVSLIPNTRSRAASATDDREASRLFTVPTVPQAALDDLRRRIAATRWPEKETVSDDSQGVQLATMQKLASYWAKDYDWRKCEAKLKALPHFVTNIDGLDIHFIHVRSKNPNALPIIITHGWPVSIIEQLKIIDPLTNPTAHGGKAEDAFDVVIPSLPGYGFSGTPTDAGKRHGASPLVFQPGPATGFPENPTAPGWDPIRLARGGGPGRSPSV